jgi:uncharacterized membrane protein
MTAVGTDGSDAEQSPGPAPPESFGPLESLLREHLSQVERVVGSGWRRLDAGDYLPAWRRATRGEPRWPASLAVMVAIALQLLIPADLAIPPRWLMPALELLLLVVLFAANPGRISREHRGLRLVGLALVTLVGVANAYSAARLIWTLVHGAGSDAGALLAVGAAIWLINVIIFALCYWEFDRGGPAARAHGRTTYADFEFPQMLAPGSGPPDWEPNFTDYFYLSFTNATAFSPTDTMPMTRWAKMTMLVQSAVSLATVALVIARAVNILK